MPEGKVLVTGGAGFIGSHIVDRLIVEGFEVIVVDDLSSGNESNINRKAAFYECDIRDPQLEEIFMKEKPDYVSHHAAQKDVRVSVADPIYDAKINILGTINVLKNCNEFNVKKIIFASTGGAIYGEQDAFPAPESHPARPISPYGITKLVAEHYMYYYKTVHGLDYCSLRYSNVYGPRQDPNGEAGVVAIFIQNMLNGKQPTINGDGKQTRDFIYVGDVAQANVLAIKNDTVENIFNIGTGIETSIKQIFEHITNALNLSIEPHYGLAKSGEQNRSVVDCSKAKKVLHWEHLISLADGMYKTCRHFKASSQGD